MSKFKHIHRYEKAKIGKNHVIYRCNLPGCTHYIDKNLVRGRLAICNRCGEAFVISIAASKLAKPHCDDCTKKKDESFEKIKEFVLEESK